MLDKPIVRFSVLSRRIMDFLNAGDVVAAQLAADHSGSEGFVCIFPQAKPAVPRESARYLNSTWSIWEYWDFQFKEIRLRNGWRNDEWNYDRYITNQRSELTHTPVAFESALQKFNTAGLEFQHISESACPL